MPIKKTLKHELEYNTDTLQAIFNGRNITGLSPVHDPLPQRLFTFKKENDIEDETLELAPANKIDEADNALLLKDGEILEESNTIEID